MQKVLTKKEYELEARKLIGQKLVVVRYYEINYGSEDEQLEQPMWNQNPDFDSLDFGVELLFQDTNSCFLIWDIKLNCIRFDFGSQEVSTNMKMWDVSSSSRWKNYLGQDIQDIQIRWSFVQENMDLETRGCCPESLELVFEIGQVFVSALEIFLDGSSFRLTDHLTVFFDEQIANQFLQ